MTCTETERERFEKWIGKGYTSEPGDAQMSDVFMGPMRDCPTHGESPEIAALRSRIAELEGK